jgi:hypothetical protein
MSDRTEELRAKLKARFANVPRPDHTLPIVPASMEQVAKIRAFEQQKKVVFDEIDGAPF